MKIIAGKHKNRVIPTSKKFNYRPSTTKFREAVFSILSSGEFEDERPIERAKVLDLFAGTGALSFEALSRGAESVLLVDSQAEHLEMAKDFAKKIGEESALKTLASDVMRLKNSPGEYNLVFMDPPYYNDYVSKSLKLLEKFDWLADAAIIVIEMEKRSEVEFSDSFKIIKEKIYGNNKLLIVRYGKSA